MQGIYTYIPETNHIPNGCGCLSVRFIIKFALKERKGTEWNGRINKESDELKG
jgi:hypothetical protein